MKALDEVFGLLDKERRRFALYYLEEADEPVSIAELAEEITKWENDPSSEGVPGNAFKDVTLTLQHHHLPKAAEAEFVEYDREESVVRLTGTPTEFDVVLSVAKAIEQPAEGDGITRLLDLV